MRATSGFIRLFIRGLAWDSTESGQRLAETLKIAARARLKESAKGKVLVGTTGGGVAVTYTLPPLGDLTPADVAEVCSAVLDQADVLVAATPAITDGNLAAALLATFPARTPPRSVSGFRPDFSCGGLRR